MTSSTVLNYFLQAAALGFAAAVSPGPFQAYLISQSLLGGWRRGALVAFAPLITDAPIILFSLFVLERLPDDMLRIISLAGALFVFYLAGGLLKSWRTGSEAVLSEVQSDRLDLRGLRQGVIANFLSPGAYLFWGLVNGPLLLTALRQSPLHGGGFLLGFYGVMVTSLLGIAVVFAQARRLGTRVVRLLVFVSALVLVGFGGVLLARGIPNTTSSFIFPVILP